jgi:predicted AlkP superfamily phosphohydrolase/phosphomutase
MSARILLLGLDAASAPLVREWARAGVLPTFQRLLQTGVVGDVRGLEGFFEGGTWPSFWTGVTPAHHGIHSFVQIEPGTYRFYWCHPRKHVQREPFWDTLSRSGRRLAIVDAPLAGVSAAVNGLQLAGWGEHDHAVPFGARPRTLGRRVRRLVGARHPLAGNCDQIGRSAAAFADFRDRLLDGIRRRTRLGRSLMEAEHWDLFLHVFSESHCVGHQCWHLHDPVCPAYSSDVVATVGDPVRQVYEALDGAVDEMLRAAGPEALVIVLLTHGMSFRHDADFLLPEVLIRLGVAVPPIEAVRRHDAVAGVDAALTRVWQGTPAWMRGPLQPARARLRGWIDGRQRPIRLPVDVRRSVCFPLNNGPAVSGIRLNLQGREPEGILRPGADAEAFCATLGRDLLDLVDAETGRAVVARVLRTAELYNGEWLDRLPDLLVDWSEDCGAVGSATCGNPTGSLRRITSKKTGVVEGVNGYVRTGEHRRDGLFIAVGPGLAGGPLPRPVSIMDFAPTVAHLLGVDLPGVDGRVIDELDARVGPPAL